jgi:hypothetical protein
VHDVMRDAYDAGAIDKQTMRQFNATYLTRSSCPDSMPTGRSLAGGGVKKSRSIDP